jgi:hypothetical protein
LFGEFSQERGCIYDQTRSFTDSIAWKPEVWRLKSFENAKEVLEIKNYLAYYFS